MKFLSTFSAGDQVDFQEAATGIDAATKIWCCKVDSMHTEATQAVKGIKKKLLTSYLDFELKFTLNF